MSKLELLNSWTENVEILKVFINSDLFNTLALIGVCALFIVHAWVVYIAAKKFGNE